MKNQKVALITAASRGMGAACAELLAARGYKLVLMSRSDDLYPLADRLDARPLKGSVDDADDLDRVIDFTIDKYERLDAVIFNTGHAAKGPILELSDSDWLSGFELLFMPLVRIVRKVAGTMSAQNAGAIVSISSFGAKEPSVEYPISSALRSALSAYTKLLAKELGPNNIRVNSILPGFIDTYPAAEELVNNIPLLRQGTPQEVAKLASFLVSDEASYITGQNFLIDGGLSNSF